MYVPVRPCQTERHIDKYRKGQGELPAFRWGNNRATNGQARQGKVKEEGGRTGGKVPSRNYPASCNNPLPRDISMVKRVRWICWKVL